jgi:hypothetical protein
VELRLAGAGAHHSGDGTITAVAIKNGRIAALVSDGAGAFRIDRFVAATGTVHVVARITRRPFDVSP